MKIKRVCAFLIISLVCVTGCGADKTVASEENMFVTVSKYDSFNVIYCRQTKVMYSVSDGMYNKGTLTELVNPDGSPMLYEEQ